MTIYVIFISLDSND